MDIQNLYYLLETAKCGSINKASANLFLSSQQLSRIIRLIEQNYNITIFERNSWGLKVTAQGEEFLSEIKKMIRINDELQEKNWCEDKTKNLKGELNIFSFSNIRNRYLQSIISFAQSYPGIKIQHTIAAPSNIFDYLATTPASVGFCMRYYLLEGVPEMGTYIPTEFKFIRLAKQKLAVYCSKDNFLAQEYKSMSLKKITDMPIILYKPFIEEDYRLKELFFKLTNQELNIQYSVGELELFFSLLENTNCINISAYFSQFKERDNLCRIPINDGIYQEFGIVYNKNAINIPAVKIFLEIVKKQYQNS